VSDPASTHGGMRSDELTIAVTWGGAQQVDIAPAGCSDPECDADHGYTGLLTPEDVVVRVSAQAEGDEALVQALDFARALSVATVSAT